MVACEVNRALLTKEAREVLVGVEPDHRECPDVNGCLDGWRLDGDGLEAQIKITWCVRRSDKESRNVRRSRRSVNARGSGCILSDGRPEC